MNDNILLCQLKTTTEPSTAFAEKMPMPNAITTGSILNPNGNESGNTNEKLGRGFVYLITNRINNKKYVGITTRDIHLRLREHIWDAGSKIKKNQVLLSAIRKYGAENFITELIDECHNITEKELYLKESYYIQKHNTIVDNGYGYNMLLYDDHRLVFSEESKRKMSLSHTGEKNHFYGKHHTEEAKHIIRKAGKQRVGENNSFYGKIHTNETIRKISNGNKTYWATHIHSRVGKTFTLESRKKNSDSHKGKRIGPLNTSYDSDIITFENTITGERFCGTAWEFTRKYNANRGCISDLKNGKQKQYKSWIVVK